MQIGIDSFAAAISDPATGLTLSPVERMRPDGIPTLRIAPSYPCVADFLETLRHIRRLRSPLQVK